MFAPPFCPHPACRFHVAPPDGFFLRHGFYKAKCRAQPVPRFRCRACRRSFSRQTFRVDYRLHKPHLVAETFRHLVSGGSLRQAARTFRVARRTIARLLERLGKHAASYHGNVLELFPIWRHGLCFQFDELETYEHGRITKPLTVATVLQEGTRFLVGMGAGTIRTRRTRNPASTARRAEFEALHGQRKNESSEVLLELLRPLRRALDDRDPAPPGDTSATSSHELGSGSAVDRFVFTTDEKRTYPALLRRTFGAAQPTHITVSSELPRDGSNPLAPTNQLDVMTRHHAARLQRESIAASKLKHCLRRHLAIFVLWWNYWRCRTNRDCQSPAYYAGVLPRRARSAELFGWRQDLGPGRLPLLTS